MKMPSSGAVSAVVPALLTLVLLLAASPALAHDALKSSDPAKNARVETVEKVKLVFTSKPRLPVVVVTGSDGTRHENGKPSIDGATVTQELNASLPKGRYTIAYRIVSSDGHPIEGEIPFTVTGGPEPSPSESPSESPSTPSPSQAASGPPPSEAAPVATPVAGEGETPEGIPGWLWIVAGTLAGIGIGVVFSMRSRKT